MEFAFLPGIGPMEIAVIAVIALLVLGPSRLPEAARSLGKGMKEMRDSFSGETDRDDDEDRRLVEDDDDFHDDEAELYAPEDEIDEDPEDASEDAGKPATKADRTDAGDKPESASDAESEPAVKTS
jgi:sec-independent protein translocase protein TatA